MTYVLLVALVIIAIVLMYDWIVSTVSEAKEANKPFYLKKSSWNLVGLSTSVVLISGLIGGL